MELRFIISWILLAEEIYIAKFTSVIYAEKYI